MRFTKLLILLASFTTGATGVSAGSITSSVFSGATASDFVITGASDWGYVESGGPFDGSLDSSTGTSDYSDLNSAVVSGSHTPGDVTIANLTSVEDKNTTDVGYSVNGTTAYGSYGGLAPDEDNAWSVTFNNLQVGANSITLFLGHSDSTRNFDIDVALTDIGGSDSTTTTTGGAISGLGGTNGEYFKYDVVVNTTDANSTLTLTFGSDSGTFGEAYWAGYTVVPEASTFALIGFSGLLLLRRRRR